MDGDGSQVSHSYKGRSLEARGKARMIHVVMARVEDTSMN